MDDHREKWLAARGTPIEKLNDIKVGDIVAIPEVNTRRDDVINLHKINRVTERVKIGCPFAEFSPVKVGIHLREGKIQGFSYVHLSHDTYNYFYPDKTELLEHLEEELSQLKYRGIPFRVENDFLLKLGGLISMLEVEQTGFLIQSRDMSELFDKAAKLKPHIEKIRESLTEIGKID